MSTFSKHKTADKKPFRRDIQALRAFAVGVVVLYHLWPGRLEGGFTGVDIFFVISGYLMTISIMKHLTPLVEQRAITVKSVSSLLVEFYARRIKRLVPAALATIGGVLALAALSGNLSVLLTNAKNAVSAATFWQNWFLANDSMNYLQQDNLIVATQHFWSLSVEEQFYLMWPLLLIVSTLITINIVVLFKKQKIPGIILPVTLVTLLSLAYGVWLTQADPTVAYYSTPARIWELMIGGIIALLPAIRNYDLKLLMPHIGFVICLYSVFFVGAEGFPGWAALLPTIGTAMIIWAGTSRAESGLAFDNVFRWRPIQWLGNISYSVYLWHWPLIILLPIILQTDINGPHGRLFKLGIIVTALIIAHLSYKYIEQGTQKLRLKTRYVYILFAIATSLVVALSFGLQRHAENQIQTNLKAMHAAAMDESNICFGARAILNQDKCGNPYGKIELNYMNVGRQDVFFNLIQDGFSRCPHIHETLATSNDTNQTNFCVYGDLTASKSIVLFGDSHMQQYLNAFHDIGLRNNYKIYLIDIAGCTGKNFMNKSPACAARYTAIGDLNRVFDSSSILIVSFLYRSYDYIVENLEFLRGVTSKDLIFFQDNAHTTVSKFNNCYSISRDCLLQKSSATAQTEAVLVDLIANNHIMKDNVISTEDFFCSDSTCYSSIGGVPVYYNTGPTFPYPKINSHITASYSLSLSPVIEQKLRTKGFLR